MGKTIERCPLCGSENIEWMGDCFDENNPTPYHCHECDRFFGENTITIEEVRKNLIKNLEKEYSQKDIEFIDIRLEEIADMEKMSLDKLDYYCTANSSEMFSCIFDYKEFDKDNFKVD